MEDYNSKPNTERPHAEEKIRRNFLTKDENDRIKNLWKIVGKKETEGQHDAKSFFEIVYLGFLKEIEDRKIVEEDLKDLQKQLNECADNMMSILKKEKSSHSST